MTSLRLVRHSLKTRITLVTLIIFVISIWTLSLYISRMLRQDMERMLGDQQYSTASIVASDVNRELDERLSALGAVAGLLTVTTVKGPAAIQSFLKQNPALDTMFNGGVFVVSRDGTALV